ncbi:MAG: hypothetical protein H0U95_18230 [Bacteroidetes bacterium]|nr:hypothetical protein [Bacteroidota bacterium]
MIIISNKPGQLGNLLFIYANFLAYSLETSVLLANPAFYPYRSYFKSTAGFFINKITYTFCYVIARVLFKLKIKTKLISAITLDWGETVELENAPLLKSKLCFAQGWLFRSDTLMKKHKQKIVDFFEPNELFKAKINSFFKNNKIENDLIIGIHIRQGDYKTFENGKYYYSTEQYLEIIKKLASLFETKQPHFLICSNETVNINEESIKGLKITFAPGHELMDMYCLAKCNYIAGPPSTYSMWASFYGNVPLYMIEDTNREIGIDDFKINLSA